MTARLRQIGTGNPQIYVLKEGTNRIGREDRGNDLLLRSSFVTRRHAIVRCKGDYCEITDLNSNNGTMLNGQRLPPQVPTPLSPNAILEFAGERFIFEHELSLGTQPKYAWLPEAQAAMLNAPATTAPPFPSQFSRANPFDPPPTRRPNYFLGLFFGVVAMVMASELAFVIAVPLGLQRNWIAIAVGLLVGGAINLGSGRRTYGLMGLSAILTFFSSVLGVLLTAIWIESKQFGLPFFIMLPIAFFDPSGVWTMIQATFTPLGIILYALAIIIGAIVAAPINWQELGE
jgi:hypothetical protein